MKSLIVYLFFFFIGAPVWSQYTKPLGTWEAHLPYQKGTSVAQTQNEIIYSTSLSLVFIDKDELSTRFLSKVDGLSDVGIASIVYDVFNDQLVVVYENSNLDFVTDQGIINVPNVFANTSISGDRRINDVFFYSKERAYFATGFGVIVFDPRSYNFISTTFTGIPVNSIIVYDNNVYAATSEGLYVASVDSDNLADFNVWSILSTDHGLPSLYDARDIVIHKGRLVLATPDVLYIQEDTLWREVFRSEQEDFIFLQETSDRLISGWSTGDFSSIIRFFDDSFSWVQQGEGCTSLSLGAIQDQQGRIWYAEGFNGFRWSSGYEAPCTQVSFNSPFSQNVSDIVISDGQVLCASGGVSEVFGFLFGREGMYLKKDRRWRNFNEFDIARLKDLELLSLFRVAFHPRLPKIYGGSYWAGLLEYDQEADTYTLYNKDNSSLRGSVGDPARERVTGLVFDTEENLWVSTYNAAQPLNVMMVDGRWQSFAVISPGTLTDIAIDHLGNKWCPVFGNAGGVLVFNSGSSIQNLSDDRQRFISRSNSVLPSNQVNCVAVDREGVVWVGTAEGPVIFDCGSQALEDECQGVRRIVFENDIAALLLADQDIRVIAVDGANNKWFGTRNGLFVQSPDGTEQLAHYTVENSPLFDNEIQALGYDGTTGEMYIGTNRGILSLRTFSTEGAKRHIAGEVYAFPNPVTPDFRDYIAIRGLVTDAIVKITNVDGSLVSEMVAQGGQALWDGRDLQGREVSSGVYLVWSSERASLVVPDSYVTKILVLR